MMPDRIAALDQYVEQHVQQGMQELVRLCNQPSISSQGLGMQECAALVAELLRSRGIAAQVMETAGYPVVYGEYGTGERTLLLYNHYDVQPPEPLKQPRRSSLVDTLNICHTYPPPFALRIFTPQPAMLFQFGPELFSHFDRQFSG